MNELGSLGLILLLALVAGHLVQRLRIPEVTGYILAGIAVGPFALGWISHDNLEAMHVLAEVALGLILLGVGAVFHFARLSKIGRSALVIALLESGAAFVLVSAGALALHQPWQVALLLGSIAMETAPASTLMVVRECNSEGPLTETLLGIIAINNLLCLTMYTLVASLVGFAGDPGAAGGIGSALWITAYSMVWQIAGSAAMGYLIGILISAWVKQITEQGEVAMLLTGGVLLCIGFSHALDLSPLVASLALGGAIVNLSARRRGIFESLSHSDPPFYAIFFVMAGADLDASLVPAMGVFGAIYLLARGAGKWFGARFGSTRLRLEQPVQRYLGFTLMAHAGLAVGITLNISQRFPEYAPAIVPIILSNVVIYEILGPVAAKFAIVNSGESRAHS